MAMAGVVPKKKVVGDGTDKPKSSGYPPVKQPKGTTVAKPSDALKKLPVLGDVPKLAGAGSGAGSGKTADANPVTSVGVKGGGPGGEAGTRDTAFQSASGGTPSGTGLGGNFFNTQSGDPFTGFASRYSPTGVGNILANPQIIANDVLASMGFGGNTGLQSALGDIASLGPALSFLMTAPAGQNAQGDEAMINTIASILKNQATPGGMAIDYRDLLGNIFGSGQDGLIRAFTSLDANGNPLAGADQSSAIKGLIQAALTNVNPYAQRAMMGQVGQGLTNYEADLARGAGANDPNYKTGLDYLRLHGMLNDFY